MAKDTKLRKTAETKDVAAPEVTENEIVTAPENEMPKVIRNRGNVQSVELQRRDLLQHYKSEKKVPVNISPMYQKYFGKVMSVAVQGITVAIPCDGKTYKINRTHAIEALSRVRKIDTSITRRERMKDVANNFESTPGEIKFY